jgi:hypothetical protein
MPYGGFKWVEPTLDGLDMMTETSDVGRLYEVDITYPKALHNIHNELPFLPHNDIPLGSKISKLMATLKNRTRYIIHYRNLKQAIANGLIVEKVNINIFLCFVIQFVYCIFINRFIEYWSSISHHGYQSTSI